MLTIPKEKLPTHIACIMDGNGRWANSRHLPRQAGHRAGADTVERCADFCMAHDIPWLTLYAFSSENWNRPKTEVRALMGRPGVRGAMMSGSGSTMFAVVEDEGTGRALMEDAARELDPTLWMWSGLVMQDDAR